MIVERKEREVTENESGVRSCFPIGRLYRTKGCVYLYICTHSRASRLVPRTFRPAARCRIPAERVLYTITPRMIVLQLANGGVCV